MSITNQMQIDPSLINDPKLQALTAQLASNDPAAAPAAAPQALSAETIGQMPPALNTDVYGAGQEQPKSNKGMIAGLLGLLGIGALLIAFRKKIFGGGAEKKAGDAAADAAKGAGKKVKDEVGGLTKEARKWFNKVVDSAEEKVQKKNAKRLIKHLTGEEAPTKRAVNNVVEKARQINGQITSGPAGYQDAARKKVLKEAGTAAELKAAAEQTAKLGKSASKAIDSAIIDDLLPVKNFANVKPENAESVSMKVKKAADTLISNARHSGQLNTAETDTVTAVQARLNQAINDVGALTVTDANYLTSKANVYKQALTDIQNEFTTRSTAASFDIMKSLKSKNWAAQA